MFDLKKVKVNPRSLFEQYWQCQSTQSDIHVLSFKAIAQLVLQKRSVKGLTIYANGGHVRHFTFTV